MQTCSAAFAGLLWFAHSIQFAVQVVRNDGSVSLRRGEDGKNETNEAFCKGAERSRSRKVLKVEVLRYEKEMEKVEERIAQIHKKYLLIRDVLEMSLLLLFFKLFLT